MQIENNPEFSRIIKIDDEILNKKFEVFAEKGELNNLAKRFELADIKSLSISYIISEKTDISGAYIFSANIKSIVTKFIVEEAEENLEIDENFDVVFLSERLAKDNEESLKEYDIEILPEDGLADVGEIAAQYLSLCVFM